MFAGNPGRRPSPDAMAPDDIRKILTCPVYSPPVRQSFMADGWSCPRYLLLRDRLGLVPKLQAPTVADTGTFFHKALEVRYGGGTFEQASDAVSTQCRDLQEALRRHWDAAGQSDRADSVVEQAEKSADLGLLMAEIFVSNNPLSSQRFVVADNEREIMCYVPEIRHYAGGRLDQAVYCRQMRGLFLRDFKSVSDRIDLADYTAGLEYDFQLRWYRYLWSRDETLNELSLPGTTKRLGELPLLGFIVSVMQRPSISQKQGQSFVDFMAECRDYYAGRPDQDPRPKQRQKGGQPMFDDTGDPVYITDKDTGRIKLYHRWDHSHRAAEWANSAPWRHVLVRFHEPVWPEELKLIASLTARAMRCTPRLGNFPRFGRLTRQCSMRFNRPCQFQELCSSPPSNWQTIVDRSFRVGEIHGSTSVATTRCKEITCA